MQFFLMVIPSGLLVWALQRWIQSKPRFELPHWRSYTAFAAFCVSAASVTLWVFTGIWALARGGFPYYDPVLLRLYSFGFFSSLTALLISLPGKGKLRWPACGIGVLMTFLWFAAATSE